MAYHARTTGVADALRGGGRGGILRDRLRLVRGPGRAGDHREDGSEGVEADGGVVAGDAGEVVAEERLDGHEWEAGGVQPGRHGAAPVLGRAVGDSGTAMGGQQVVPGEGAAGVPVFGGVEEGVLGDLAESFVEDGGEGRMERQLAVQPHLVVGRWDPDQQAVRVQPVPPDGGGGRVAEALVADDPADPGDGSRQLVGCRRRDPRGAGPGRGRGGGGGGGGMTWGVPAGPLVR